MTTEEILIEIRDLLSTLVSEDYLEKYLPLTLEKKKDVKIKSTE